MRANISLVAITCALLLCHACGGDSPSARVVELGSGQETLASARGPLRRLAENPRYFTDGSGKAVLLVGSHTWDNRQDLRGRPFDWADYLSRLRRHNHNFIRLWIWEQPRDLSTWPDPADPESILVPEVFARTGPGTAADGGLRFDLTAYNQSHFDRLRDRVVSAGNQGIYVSVMLFNGWSVEKKAGGANPWTYHPFRKGNNVNGIDGDIDGDQSGSETQTLRIPAVTRLQEAYLRKVVDTVNDLDNVLYEVSNESNMDSEEWQYHVVNYVKWYQSTKKKQHPVGMTAFGFPHGQADPRAPATFNSILLDSPADWISPIAGGERTADYTIDPPPATGQRVILVDTDHLWGIGGSSGWAWKSFTRGLNIIYMDPWDSRFIPAPANPDLRRTMGFILLYANRMDLARAKPRPELASTGYCLAHPGSAYVIYAPGADEWLRPKRILGRLAAPFIYGRVEVDLSADRGTYAVEWFNPRTGVAVQGGTVTGGRKQRLQAPFAGAAVLYMAESREHSSRVAPA